MAFAKGRPKTGGRQPGSPNKVSATVSERLEQFGVDPVRGLLSIVANADASLELKAKVFSELCSYCFPKQKHVEISAPTPADFSLDELRQMLSKIQQAREPSAKETINQVPIDHDLNDEPNGKPVSDEELAALLQEEIVRRETHSRDHNFIDQLYPDSGPLARSLYPQHQEFFAGGAMFKERLFGAAIE